MKFCTARAHADQEFRCHCPAPGVNPFPKLLPGGAGGTAPAGLGRAGSGPRQAATPGAQAVGLLPLAARLLHLQPETSVDAKLPSVPREQH